MGFCQPIPQLAAFNRSTHASSSRGPSVRHPTCVIALRLKNIVAFALGKMTAWGLDTPAMKEDPWDYQHITTWNLLPFQLRHAGAAPLWVDRLTLVLWWVSLIALAWVLLRLRRIARTTTELAETPVA